MPLPRNDVRQYEELSEQWWRPGTGFDVLRWIARARAELVPPANRPNAVLVDLGCGGGLLAPYVKPKGYAHVGVDLVTASLELARDHGVKPVRADVNAIPLADGCADVVSAGELLEHVADPSTVVAEACRVLRPGGTLVLDTVNATARARFIVVTVGERIPGLAPKGLHDPRLFVRPEVLVNACAKAGVRLNVRGLRPPVPQLLLWLVRRRGTVRMVASRSVAMLYQGWGIKEA
jgi:2-polyprenyl-6-hydroxyphenyl methylase / 3-demethylubiquinone-9 3-methyltransferase